MILTQEVLRLCDWIPHAVVPRKRNLITLMLDENELRKMREELSTEDVRRNFTAMLKGCKEVGMAMFVEEFSEIDNIARHLAQFQTTEQGLFNIHHEIIIHPRAYQQMLRCDRIQLVKVAEKIHVQGEIVKNDEKVVNKLRAAYRLVFNRRQSIYYRKLCITFGVDKIEQTEIAGIKIFDGIKPFEVIRLHQVFAGTCQNYNEHCVKFGREFAAKQGCKDVTEYCAAIEYAIICLNKVVKQKRRDDSSRNKQKTEVYRKAALDELLTPGNENFVEFEAEFKDLQQQCTDYNDEVMPNLMFANAMAAAYHYKKHKKSDENLRQYLERAISITSGQTASEMKCMWTQEGSTIVRQYICPDKTFAVRIDKPNHTSVIATMFVR